MSQNQTKKVIKRTISNLYVLNCFKYFQIYILGQMSQENLKRKLYQVLTYDSSMTYFILLMHLKHYSVKANSISFFSSSDMQRFHHFLGCHTIVINSLSFFQCFTFFKFTTLSQNSDKNNGIRHCVKSVQIQSFFWSVFSYILTEYGDLLCKSPYSVRIQKNTDHKKTPYLDAFHAVGINFIKIIIKISIIKINSISTHIYHGNILLKNNIKKEICQIFLELYIDQ